MATTQLPPEAESTQLDRKTLLALVDASRAINQELKLENVFQRIAEHACTVMRAEGSSLLLYESQRQELLFKTVVGPSGAELIGTRFDATLGIAGQVIKTARAVRVDDVSQNANFFQGIDAKTNMRTRGLLAAPLVFHEQVLGVVEVINPVAKSRFTDADLELLRIFANLAASALRNAQAFDKLSSENRGHRAAAPAAQIIGDSPPIQHALALCQKVGLTNATVLLCGETGTGKEMAARAVHNFSRRSDKPFVAINCAALPESLLESELFGHEKGAFTGASNQKLGRFELADGGTLFLDEVGEVPQPIQAKLLRVLQEREFVRVGGTQTLRCDVRIIAATNRDLKAESEAGRFREDLYYRLNVFPIELPPLRERIEDLPLLIDHFVRQLAPELGVAPPRIDEGAMRLMMQYDWPGNIRELRNIMERCTLLAGGEAITAEVLPTELRQGEGAAAVRSAEAATLPGAETLSAGRSKLADHERALILKALRETDWNQSAAARTLGISRDHLRYRLKKYRIKKPPGE